MRSPVHSLTSNNPDLFLLKGALSLSFKFSAGVLYPEASAQLGTPCRGQVAFPILHSAKQKQLAHLD